MSTIKYINDAIRAVVAFSDRATIETLPHEYIHPYLILLKDRNLVRLGRKWFPPAHKQEHKDEGLARAISKYYLGRHEEDSLRGKERSLMHQWLRKFVVLLKKLFGTTKEKQAAVLEQLGWVALVCSFSS